ncbi:MAG TPA: sigma-70 family RNA polymerase sigma factor [Gaiellaceae bacterium]|nr:sigma-70 family RNA polymerase sigma factor [Gaiellaceae bacterium]
MFRRDPLADPEPLIKRVYAYAAYRLGDGPDAEDVTSETFERALRYRKSYDPRKGEPVAWLLGIAKRCIDGSWQKTEYATEDLDAVDTRDLEEETVRRLTISRAVAVLDERDRELIALRYGADLTARQIAELLGARTNAIEVALHRALGRLRGILGVDEDEPVRKRGASR